MLTYEDAMMICEKNESFKVKHQTFGNTTVAQFTYFLASAGDFFDAHKDRSMISGTELRGLTFVKEGDGEWQRYLFLSKFFNVNQCNGSDITWMNLTINGVTEKVNINELYSFDGEQAYRAIDLKVGMVVGKFNRAEETVGELFTIETLEKEVLDAEFKENSWMYDDLKDLQIVRVANKEDGSAVRFMMIEGELVAKTKFSFESEQCELAMKVVESNSRLKEFIMKTLEMRLAALFEIVSPLNKIVLSYNETTLHLLQMRDEETGEYLDIYDNDLVEEYGVSTADKEVLYSLEELMEMSETVEDKEGWVITFSNGKMAKQKSRWYMRLHDIMSFGLRENKLIERVLCEEVDDLLSFIPVEAYEERDYINELTNVIISHVNHLATQAYDLFNAEYNGDRREFAIKYNKHSLFSFMVKLFGENTFETVEKAVIKNVIFKTRKLKLAQEYLRDLGFERELKLLEEDN